MDQIFSDCVEYKIFSEALLSKVSDNIFLVAEERSHARDVEEGVGKVTARKKRCVAEGGKVASSNIFF